MIFAIHYFFFTSGMCAIGILLGVFLEEYSDATKIEIAGLYLTIPLSAMLLRPYLCSLADRNQAHKKYLIVYLLVFACGYVPFLIVPLFPSFYLSHPRGCWYIFCVFKVIGDIGLGGVAPMGDSLAINYAERIGTDYCSYRKWGTMSWGLFGIIIGQINELPYFPKYVPGFAVLCFSTVAEAVLVWLWPDEFFKMVPKRKLAEKMKTLETENSNKLKEKKTKGESKVKPKHLMSYSQVWHHIKRKLLCQSEALDSQVDEMKLKTYELAVQVKQATFDSNSNGKSAATIEETVKEEKQINNGEQEKISVKTQMSILFCLFRKDPRILMYLVLVMFAGIFSSLLNFLFLYLAEVCVTTGECNFSHLAGYLQSIPAAMETVFFIYLTPIKKIIGRMNLLSIAFAIHAARFFYYAHFFRFFSPYTAIISESLQGVAFGTYIVILAEVAHEFSNEIELVLPGLCQRTNLVDKNVDPTALLLVLSSTMQAVFSSSMDGIGRASGALISGYLSEAYDFITLWKVAGLAATFVAATSFLGNFVASKILHYEPRILSTVEEKQLDLDSKQIGFEADASNKAPRA